MFENYTQLSSCGVINQNKIKSIIELSKKNTKQCNEYDYTL